MAGKKSKISRKRAERRERAKSRLGGDQPEHELLNLSTPDESEAEPEKEPAAPKQESREKKPKPEKSARESDRESGGFARIKEFLREVDIERKKINWPATSEAMRSTWVVVITILFLAGFMGVTSVVFGKIGDAVFGLQYVDQSQVAPTGDVPIPGSIPRDVTPTDTGGGATEGGGDTDT